MSSPTFRVLIALRDDAEAEQLVATFVGEGDHVERVSTVLDAKALLSTQLDIALIGFDLPDGNPLEFCREVTSSYAWPVVLVGRCSRDLKIMAGIEAGAVDLLALPARAEEVLCRVRGRLLSPAVNGNAANRSPQLISGDVRVDQMRRRVWVKHIEVRLRSKEFDLLVFLMASQGTTFSRDQLMRHVWNTDWWSSTKTVDVHIGALRRRLGDFSPVESRVASVRGAGYKFMPRYKD